MATKINPVLALPSSADEDGKHYPILGVNGRPLIFRNQLCHMLEVGIYGKDNERMYELIDQDMAIGLAIRLKEGKSITLSGPEVKLLLELVDHEQSKLVAWARQLYHVILDPMSTEERYRKPMQAVLKKSITVVLPGDEHPTNRLLDKKTDHKPDQLHKVWLEAERKVALNAEQERTEEQTADDNTPAEAIDPTN